MEQFAFDTAFPMDTTQQQVYDATAADLVTGVLTGYNGTMFAYGQTGSGKTYTMNNPHDRGVLQCSLSDLFERLRREVSTARPDSNTAYLVQAYYIQIYNEEVYDLLAPGPSSPSKSPSVNKLRKDDRSPPTSPGALSKRSLGKNKTKPPSNPLRIREHKDYGFYVEGVTKRNITSPEEALHVLEQGTSGRMVAATAMNDESSRSHAVFTVTVERRTSHGTQGGSLSIGGRLNFVDLAGSENLNRSMAEGSTQTETKMINLSLTTLNLAIKRLTDKSGMPVPFRDSKLTMVLKDSLGGTSRCVMLACISPSHKDAEETRSTLRHAASAKKIKNRPRQNIGLEGTELEALQEELAELRARYDQTSRGTIMSQRMLELSSYLIVPKSVQRLARTWKSNTIGLRAKQKKAEEVDQLSQANCTLEESIATKQLSLALQQKQLKAQNEELERLARAGEHAAEQAGTLEHQIEGLRARVLELETALSAAQSLCHQEQQLLTERTGEASALESSLEQKAQLIQELELSLIHI
eukprot:TRINITY_DN3200_c0_g5_i3.p1 TRINITY_DN3200_c0_g5~~TRINITY_DN3200_c0_g5_i3.p1  ORF type:complete len:525 (-),score=138.52 TRINITY_DN3200_c0_g5_i3:125-1699(-)